MNITTTDPMYVRGKERIILQNGIPFSRMNATILENGRNLRNPINVGNWSFISCMKRARCLFRSRINMTILQNGCMQCREWTRLAMRS
eukprot:2956984-Pleurochrysis_carterae.AAC.1